MQRETRVWMGLAVLAVAAMAAGGAWAQEKAASADKAASTDKAPRIELADKDVAGRDLKVPVAGQTTVLLFVRLDQAQSQKAMTQAEALLKDAKQAKVIAIVSGDDANMEAKQLVAAGKWPWPIVADTKYAVSGRLGVRVWPTTLVGSAEGEQIAHIGGLPASYSKDLEAYMSFAAGTIDRATLQTRLAGSDFVADSTDQKARRHIEVALRLIEKGMVDQAKAELAKAAELKPADPRLQLSLAHSLLAVGSTPAAETLIGQLDPKRVSAADLNLLRGRVAMAQDKWAEARKLLEEAIKINPEPSEAYYFLGMVYQHEQNAPKAAESFRKAFESSAAGKALGLGSPK